MCPNNLSSNTRLIKVLSSAAAGGGMLSTASVKMDGYNGVQFFGTLSTANAGNVVNISQSEDDVDFNDLAGTAKAVLNDGDTFLIDVYRPGASYLRAEIDRSGADTAVGDVFALLYGSARVKPSSHGPTVDASLHISPSEGAP